MADEGASLAAIRSKELEFRERLERLKTESSAKVEAARKNGEALIEEKRSQGEADGKREYQAQIETAQAEAASLREQIPDKIEELNELTAARIETLSHELVNRSIGETD